MTLDLASRDRCFVIAEAGTCHADPDPVTRFRKAIDYVHAAKMAGADAVKFQWFAVHTDGQLFGADLFCPYPGDGARVYRWRDSILPVGQWAQVKEAAEACGLVFLASAFQDQTVAWLKELGVVASKVASRAAATFPYDRAPYPYLISLGMHRAPDGLDLTQCWLLECEANYPSTARWQRVHPGFSDHSGNPWRAIDAIMRGCKLVEVHYFLDERDAGPDLPASLTLDQLRAVCEARDAFATIRTL